MWVLTANSAVMQLGDMQAKIVVPDYRTLDSGDLTWKDLEALAECTIYDQFPLPTFA